MQWCSRRQRGLVLFMSTNDSEKTKVCVNEFFLVLNSDLHIC